MDTTRALSVLLNSTDEEERWRAAHLIHSHGGVADRDAVLRALWNEPPGDRQAALMEAARPGEDANFASVLTRVLSSEDGRYTEETRAIGADWLAPVVRGQPGGLDLLLACLRDRAPSVRRSAVCVASHFLSVPSVRTALEELRDDNAVVGKESIADLVRSFLSE